MIEVLIEAVHPVMTVETAIAKDEYMECHVLCVHLTMTGSAGIQIERSDIIVMTVITLERLTHSRKLVTV